MDDERIPSATQIESCRRKRRFGSEREADDAAYLARMEGQALGIYKCDWCHGWHLTKRAASDH